MSLEIHVFLKKGNFLDAGKAENAFPLVTTKQHSRNVFKSQGFTIRWGGRTLKNEKERFDRFGREI